MSKQVIAIADDDPAVLTSLAEPLEAEGYEVLRCADGTALRTLLEKRHSEINVVVSDIQMPGFTGPQILNQIVVEGYAAKVILVTGFIAENDARDLIDSGCFGFLAKPVMSDELVNLVKSALAPAEAVNGIAGEYAAISIDHFLSGKDVVSSIYLRFADGRFVKLAHAGNKLELAKLHRFKERGIKELWIARADLAKYGEVVQKLSQAAAVSTVSANARHHVTTLACEFALENIRLLGVNGETVSAGFTAFQSILDNFTKNPDSIDVAALFKSSDQSLYAHLSTCGAMAACMTVILGWTSSKSIETLVMSAFLHDIGLYSLPPELQKIHSPLANQPEQRTQYQTHPQVAYNILKDLGPTFGDIALTVLDHHEDGLASAYPRGRSRSEIYPMSRNLILIEHFTEAWARLNDEARAAPGASAGVLKKMNNLPIESNSLVALDVLLKSKTLAEAKKKLQMQQSRR